MDLEEAVAMIAVKVITDAGGEISFNGYDEAMKPIQYWKPMHWGFDALNKDNADKRAVFSACKLGYLEQTKDGYKIKPK